ncbi:MAG: hypothetical protein EP343_34120 [Deltaproteobacteria bacterium]|nr:MAG: hypothetical protein EP343_34120 [Deltaproteobacteria bacterium]
MWIRVCVLGFFLLGVLGGCSQDSSSCQTNADCSDGQRCVKRVCSTVALQESPPTQEPASESLPEEPSGDDAGTTEGGVESPPEPVLELTPEEQPQERATLCSDAEPCPTSQACKEGLCVGKCGSSADCPDATNYVCNGGACQRKCNLRLGKAVNPVCPTGSFCEGYCQGSPLPQKGSRTKGQTCSKTEASLSCDGSKGFFCAEPPQAPNPLCVKACDPRDGVGNNAACETGQLCEEDIHSFEQGRCVSPANQKDGDPCDATNLRCQVGLVCYRGVCRPGCALDKGRQNNPDCPKPSEYWCNELTATSTQEGVCLQSCEPYKGVNACPVGAFCFGGYCLPGRSRPEGQGVAGTACGGSTGESCDGAKGFFCSQGASSPICRKACDPRKGVDNNAECGNNERCLEDNDSFLQGRCIPPPSRKLNETCNEAELRCIGDLQCVQGICHKPCDYKLGDTNNAGCSGVGSNGNLCWGSVCKASCDIRKGIAINPDCPVGAFCQKVSSNSQSFLGYCSYSPLQQSGTRVLDQPCSHTLSTLACDGAANLFCHTPELKCVKACDPRKGETSNPLCGTNQLCVEDIQSYLQGRCVANNIRKKGEPCTLDFPCAKGLFCREGKCAQPCDIGKGLSSNPACTRSEYCETNHNVTEVIGFCDPLPALKKGTFQLGDSCSNFTARLYCDGTKGLVCDAFSSTCVQGCHPKDGIYDNATCGKDTQCLEEVTFSHEGGYCVTLTQIFTGFCDNKQFRCKAGLVCVNSVCRGKCDPSKGVANNPDCTKYGTGFLCDGQFQAQGVCVLKCDPSKGSLRNSVCPSGTYCAESLGSLAPGVCKDTPDSGGTATEGQACLNTFSTPANQKCAKDLACVDGACRRVCDPKDPQPSRTCIGNTSCVANRLIYSGGACLSPATQKAGTPCYQSLARCVAGLECRNACVKPCDIQKGATSNPDCGAGEVCVVDATNKGGCYKPCDPSKGAPVNPACGVGSYCVPDTTGLSGSCQFSPPALEGGRAKGNNCSYVSFAYACNSKSKLFCSQGSSQSICLTACDPRQGATNNPNCGTNEECLVDTESYLQGRCQPQPTQQAETWCDRLNQICLSAFTCYLNMCHVPCDPSKGETSNPDCATFATGARCISVGPFGVCRRPCALSKGAFANDDCSVGTYCVPVSGKPADPTGLCQPLAPPPSGTKQLDEPCQRNFPGLGCDGSKGLVCAFGVCRPACDPRLKGTDCPRVPGKTSVCNSIPTSFKGGFCQ